MKHFLLTPWWLCLLLLSLAAPSHAFKEFTHDELTMQSPDWCKNADAMVLDYVKGYKLITDTRWRTQVRFGKGSALMNRGRFEATTSVRIKIFTNSGKEEYGNINIELPRFEYIRDGTVEARTITPSGKVIEVNLAKAFTKSLAYRSELGWPAEYKIAFPEVTEGAILELEYISDNDVPLLLQPHYFDYGRLPTRSSILTFALPKSTDYSFQPVNTEGFNLKKELVNVGVLGEDIRLATGVSNVYIDHDLPVAPPPGFRRPYLLLVIESEHYLVHNSEGLVSWNKAASMVSDLFFRGFQSEKSSLKAIYDRVLSDSAGSAMLPERLYHWVCDSIQTVGGEYCYDIGFDEHAKRYEATMDSRIKTRSATAAEKVLLLKALYDLANMKARPLLVIPTDEGAVVPSLPTFAQFNRSILALESGGKTTYLDPSRQHNPFGLIPFTMRGTLALPVDELTDSCVTIPFCKDKNVVHCDLKCIVNGNGDLHGSGMITLTNQYRYDYFNEFQKADSQGIRTLAHDVCFDQLRPEELTIVRAERDSSSDRRFRVIVEFNRKGYARNVGDELIIAPVCVTRIATNLFPADSARKEDIHLGFPRTMVCKMEYELPQGYTLASQPQSITEGGASGLSYFLTVGAASDSGGIVCNRNFTRDYADYDARGYSILRDYYNKVATHDAMEVVLRKGGTR